MQQAEAEQAKNYAKSPAAGDSEGIMSLIWQSAKQAMQGVLPSRH